MKSINHLSRHNLFLCLAPALTVILAFSLAACGGGGDDDNADVVTPPPAASVSEAPPATDRTVIGVIDTSASVQPLAVTDGTILTLDESSETIALDSNGRFEIQGVTDGNHSFFLHHPSGAVTEIPFRIVEGRSLSLGTVRVDNGTFEHTGFNGFHFGFVDENNDGRNDLFVDGNGDGICDNAALYAGYPYFIGHGWSDANGDGINDRYRDIDGDGRNDVSGEAAGPGFGLSLIHI